MDPLLPKDTPPNAVGQPLAGKRAAGERAPLENRGVLRRARGWIALGATLIVVGVSVALAPWAFRAWPRHHDGVGHRFPPEPPPSGAPSSRAPDPSPQYGVGHFVWMGADIGAPERGARWEAVSQRMHSGSKMSPREIEAVLSEPSREPVGTPLVVSRGNAESFVGRVDDYGAAGRAYVARFDGDSMRPRWVSPPLDQVGEPKEALFLMLVGDFAVATTSDGRAWALDLESGSLVAETHLERRARLVCAPTADVVRIDDVTGASFEFDARARAFRGSKTTCAQDEIDHAIAASHAPPVAHPPAVRRANTVQSGLDYGEVNAAVPWGRIVRGYDQASERWSLGAFEGTPSNGFLWVRPMGDRQYDHHADDLLASDGTLVAFDYETAERLHAEDRKPTPTGERFLSALDARTGEPLWTARAPSGPGGMPAAVVTPRRIYIARSGILRIWSREGAYLGSIEP